MLFEIATRKKYRYPYKGQISTEDLCDLTTEQLNNVFKVLNAQRKVDTEDSLLSKPTAEEEDLLNKIKIVKYIFDIKIAEASARREAAERKQKKQRIMEIIEQKKDESLKGMSLSELNDLLSSM